ncbi:MAG: HEAT repeat domain-containing protein [Clostridia bacterium]|nr:HEAT repeat domain-containing protein [Deltaproteobacteria bacterium]
MLPIWVMALTSPPTFRVQSAIELLRNGISSVACVCVVLSAPAYASEADPAQDGETVPRSNDAMNPVARQDRELYINRLIDALGHDDAFKVRLQAAVLLGRSNDERAASALVSALAGDQHYTVRAAAATALANLSEEKGLPHIIKAIGVDKEQFVREEAERALAKFDRTQALPVIIAAYTVADDVRVRKVALAYAVSTPNSEVEPMLVRGLGDAPDNYALAKTAVLQLPADRKLALLQRGIDDREASVRRGSVNVLREMNSAEAARMVLAVYERDIEVEEVRSAARDSLRAMRTMLPIVQFVKDAQSSSERYARARAIKLLGVVGGDEAEKVLREAAKDDEIYIRGSAVLAMQYLGSQAVVPTLEKLAGDPDNARILLQIRSVLKHLRDDHTVTASAGAPK